MAHFTDLIGLPYLSGGRDPSVGVDCLWAVRQAAERIFPGMAGWELPVSSDEEEAAIANAGRSSSKWRIVGTTAAAATDLGDIVHGVRPDDEGTFVAIVIDTLGNLALTASADHGVHTLPVKRLQGVRHVLRRSP